MTAVGSDAAPLPDEANATSATVTAPAPKVEDPTDTGYSFTLLGNWFEERVLRSCTGEGRCIPQRHVRRSGLLRDFLKKPTDGYRKSDNTFERVYGHRVFDVENRTSRQYGQFFVEGNVDHEAQMAAEAPGPRYTLHTDAREALIDGMMAELDRKEAEKRIFKVGATSREFFTRPAIKSTRVAPVRDGGRKKKAEEEAKKIRVKDTGERPDVKTQVNYQDDPAKSFYLECAMSEDTEVRSNVKVTAPTGLQFFGRDTNFSTPVYLYDGLPHKDYDNNKMFQQTKDEKRDANVPRVESPRRSDSLSGFVEKMRTALQAAHDGAVFFLAALRSELKKIQDEDGFVAIENYKVLVTKNGEIELSPFKLKCFFDLLRINDDVNVSKFMQAFRPSVANDKVKAIDEHCIKMFGKNADGSTDVTRLANTVEFQALAAAAGLKTVEDARTFWYDIAPFVSLDELKKLFPESVSSSE